MKHFTLVVGLLISISGFAAELHDFDQIKNAVINGKTIHIVTDFSKCTSPKKTEAMITGTFTPNTMLVMNDRIATSFTHFTLDHPAFAGKAVVEFIKYTLKNDNHLDLTTQVVDAINYLPLSDKITFDCKIDSDVKVYE